MATYVKTYKCPESMAVERGQEWSVTEGNKIAERWRVLRAGKREFTVEIRELIPA